MSLQFVFLPLMMVLDEEEECCSGLCAHVTATGSGQSRTRPLYRVLSACRTQARPVARDPQKGSGIALAPHVSLPNASLLRRRAESSARRLEDLGLGRPPLCAMSPEHRV